MDFVEWRSFAGTDINIGINASRIKDGVRVGRKIVNVPCCAGARGVGVLITEKY